MPPGPPVERPDRRDAGDASRPLRNSFSATRRHRSSNFRPMFYAKGDCTEIA